MRLKILLPVHVLLDEEAVKVTGEGRDGAFCLLPRHIDFVTALEPGLLSFETPAGEEVFVAVAEGILVKRGEEVLVSAANAVRGGELGQLRRTVEEEFRNLDERETSARTALYKIEATFVHRFIESQDHG